MKDLLILGGGPAGLGAAYRAASAGWQVTLLERAAAVGGAAASFRVGGMRVDHGSHRLHPSIAPDILAVLRSLMGDELQRRTRHGRIRLQGRWIAFPLRAGDLFTHLPPAFAAAAARDALTGWARRPREDSFADVLRCGLGTTMCRHFYFPYARKLWGVEPDGLDGEQARRRVAANSPARLVRRVIGQRDPDAGTFLYPAGGFGRIAEALADAAAAAGADVRLSCPVSAVELDAEGVTVTAYGRTFAADAVLSTIPLPALAAAAGASPQVTQAGEQLAFRALALVYLVVEQSRYTPFDAHYLPGPATPVVRVSEPKNYRDSPDDPTDRTVLCAEVPCTVGDAIWTASDDALGDLVVSGLVAVGLPRPPVVQVVVRRLPRAYPIYHHGYQAAFDQLDRWAQAQPRLLTFGRQGLFAHDNTHHALAMAWAAVDGLTMNDGIDHAAWAVAREGFRRHVVED